MTPREDGAGRAANDDAPLPEGPPGDEVLDVGQEEVFSRAEVELGRIEHSTVAGNERRRKAEDEEGGAPERPQRRE